ncbi:hypothetical protein DOY81_015136, partial [Sarcophaga bullata]
KILTGSVLLFALIYLAVGIVAQNSNRFDERGLYRTGQYYDPYYSNHHFRNREAYNKRRQYYDNFYKKYNPNINPKEARIVEQILEPNGGDGRYAFMFETENGIHNEAHGIPITLANGDQAEKVEGSFSYVTPEGVHVTIKYVADENGYR